jgi:hypothetical protein
MSWSSTEPSASSFTRKTTLADRGLPCAAKTRDDIRDLGVHRLAAIVEEGVAGGHFLAGVMSRMATRTILSTVGDHSAHPARFETVTSPSGKIVSGSTSGGQRSRRGSPAGSPVLARSGMALINSRMACLPGSGPPRPSP